MTTMQEQIRRLEGALRNAESSLTSAGPADRADIEAQIGQKQSAIEALRAQAGEDVDAMRKELETLRGEVAERQIREQAQSIAAQIATGVKQAQNNEKARISGIVAEELSKVLGTSNTDFSMKGLVAEALGEVRLGRKHIPEVADDVAAGQPYQGGGTLIRGRKDKGNLREFLLAAGRKDLGALSEMQAAAGIVRTGYGVKALGEGFGSIAATNAITGPGGGYIVPPDFSTELIPLLYPFVTVRRAGATVMNMRSPNFLRPRLSAGSTALYRGEATPIQTSQQTFDQFSLMAKELAGLVPVSAELVADSDPAVEDIVKADLSMQIGLKEDITFLFGAGGPTIPLGILNRSDIQIIAGNGTSGDTLSYGMIVDMIIKLRRANIPRVKQAWFGHPDMVGTLAKITDSYGRPIFSEFNDVQRSTLNPDSNYNTNPPTPPDYTLMGRPFYDTSQMPETTISGPHILSTLALVEMSQIVIGQLGQMEIAASTDGTFTDANGNTISAFQNNLVLYRAIMRHDIAPLHPSAIVTHTNVLVG